ncbi:MAG: carbon-nitrogen hydrolase family protein, partial [Armatimonadetes bacterium]|nr:carbon-nitrogen hydrolase family protein [Armatimonadota bacterium]
MGLNGAFIAAAVQMDVLLGGLDANLSRVIGHLGSAAASGARLVVFPECALSGYCFGSAAEAKPYALLRSDWRLQAFADACSRHEVIGVLGFLEVVEDSALCNSALIAVPGCPMWVYRKTHLPTLGVDRFVRPGDDLPVLTTPLGIMGTLICYDARFPEAARVLTLRGADVIALPTNWPEGGESAPPYVLRARARENVVTIVAANRIGVERGRRFIGRSQIVGSDGVVLAQAGDGEEVLLAPVDIERSRRKRIVFEPP